MGFVRRVNAEVNKPDKSHDAYRLKRVVSYETV